jgi:hypothetical protein
MDREKLYKDLRDVLSKITLLLKTLEGMQTPKADARFARAHSDELAGDVRAVEEDIKAHNTESLAWRVNELALDVRAEAARQEQAARTIDAQLPGTPRVAGTAAARRQLAEDLRHAAEPLDPLAKAAEDLLVFPLGPAPHPTGDPVIDNLLQSATKDIEHAAADKTGILREHDEQAAGRNANYKTYAPTARETLSAAADQAIIGAAETGLAATELIRNYLENPVGSPTRPLRVQMKRADVAWTPDTAFQMYIRASSESMEYNAYDRFMERVLCGTKGDGTEERERVRQRPLRLPFPDTDPYRFLKVATEVFMMANCGTWGAWERNVANGRNMPQRRELEYADRRLGMTFTESEIMEQLDEYLQPHPEDTPTLPYLALIRQKLGDVPLAPVINTSDPVHTPAALAACSGIMQERLRYPCLVELIWSYWMEEGMLVQTLNAISRRFQNMRAPTDRDPLATLELDPLRPLNNFLWGYIQDEQHRLTVIRRAYEYDHHYGLALVGRAVPQVKAADSRKRFLEAFHQLLHLCTIFYKEDDDTTVIADAFPLVNALREVHIILSQGAHNQYGDLPWTARQEMLMQQWLLSRGEMREFLPGRIMVAYPEPWMDRVEAMKGLMGWTDSSILHFRELAIFGERILLGIRFNDWTRVIESERAGNWARYWRPEISGYIHAYRAVTGVDLADRVDATMPSTLLRNRLVAQRLPAR